MELDQNTNATCSQRHPHEPQAKSTDQLTALTIDAPSEAELRKLVTKAARASRHVDSELRRTFAQMAQQVIDSVKPFRFLDLPSELRTRIYESLMLKKDSRMVPSICARGKSDGTKPHKICLVNRQIRQEALSIYYGGNVFRAHIHRNDFSFFTSWLDLIGDSNRKRLRTVHFALQDRWLCADGLLDLVRTLTRISGTEKLAVTIDTKDWVHNFSRTYDSVQREHITNEKPIQKTFKMLERALILVQSLRETGDVSETKLRYEFRKWLDMKGYKCGGHSAPSVVHDREKEYYGFCSVTGRETSQFNPISCDRGFSALYEDMRKAYGPHNTDSEEEIEEGLRG